LRHQAVKKRRLAGMHGGIFRYLGDALKKQMVHPAILTEKGTFVLHETNAFPDSLTG
jgi:hypothetical protein